MSVHAEWRAIAKTEAMYDRCQSAQRLASYGVAKTEQSAYGEMFVHAEWRAIAKTELSVHSEMIPESNDVAARRESLNHDLRFFFLLTI